VLKSYIWMVMTYCV